MRSEPQNQASRANGCKSRGPITEEGKRVSSQNAVKHGMLAKFVVINSENEPGFIDLTARLYDELQPQPGIEQDLVNTMAVARWRTTRLWIIEKSSMETQMTRENDQARAAQHKPGVLAGMAFRSLADNSRTLDLINRYESRYDRQYLRSHKRLLDIRKLSEPNEPNPDVPEGHAAFSRVSPTPDDDPNSAPDVIADDSVDAQAPAVTSPDVSAEDSTDAPAPADSAPGVSAGNSSFDETNSAKQTQDCIDGPAATSRGKGPAAISRGAFNPPPVTRIKNNSKRRRLLKLQRKSLPRGPAFSRP